MALKFASWVRRWAYGARHKSRAIKWTPVSILLPTMAGVLFTIWSVVTEERRYIKTIYKMLCKGSRPQMEYPEISAFRSERGDIAEWFLSGRRNKFGVIHGPSGSGKSYIVKDLCINNPSGVLYFEVKPGMSIAKVLRAAAGVRLTLPDHYLSWMFPSRFEGGGEESLLFNSLEKAASEFKTKQGFQPVMFIDAADLLVKYDEVSFQNLVYFARGCANEKNLIIVFISSDGAVLPAVKSLSACANRAWDIQIGDLDKGTSIKYLTDHGLPDCVSKEVHEYVGGRIVDLEECARVYTKGDTSEEVLKKSKSRSKTVSAMKYLVALEYSEDIERFLEKAGDGWCRRDTMTTSVADALIFYNILRDDGEGNLTWHSKRVYNELKLKFRPQ